MLTKWCCHTQSQLTNNISPLGPYLQLPTKNLYHDFLPPPTPIVPYPIPLRYDILLSDYIWKYEKAFFFFLFGFSTNHPLTFIYSCPYLDTYIFIICRFFKNWKNNSALYLWFYPLLLKPLFIKKRVNFYIRILDHTCMEIYVGRNTHVYRLKSVNR